MSSTNQSWDAFGQVVIGLLAPDPDRKASEILTNCISTIIGCTALCLFLNLPDQDEASQSRWKEWKPLLRQFKWGVAMIFAPEILVSRALGEWRFHRNSSSICKRFARGDLREWTSAQVHFANMGGLILRLQVNVGGLEDWAHLGLDSRFIKIWEVLRQREFHKTTPQELRRAIYWYFAIIRKHWQRLPLIHQRRKRLRQNDRASQIEENSISRWQTPPSVQASRTTATVYNSVQAAAEAGVLTISTHLPMVTRRQEPRTVISTRNSLDITDAHGQERDQEGAANIESDGTEVITFPQNSTRSPPIRMPRSEILDLYLNTTQLVVAQSIGIIKDVPPISQDTIDDKSQRDLLPRLLSILKLLHFIFGIVYLLASHHEITLVELVTTAYVGGALVTYCLCWSKPQAVQAPEVIDMSRTRLSTTRTATKRDLELLALFGGSKFINRGLVLLFGADHRPRGLPDLLRPDNLITAPESFGSMNSALFDADLGSIMAGMLLGLVHCLAWDHEFASRFECLAWRAASVVVTLSLIPYAAANAASTSIDRSNNTTNTHANRKLGPFVLLSVYVLCRMFLVLAMLRAVVVERPG